MSFDSTVISASLPGTSDPLIVSSNPAYAALMVYDRSASHPAHSLIRKEDGAVFQLAGRRGIERWDRIDVLDRCIRAVGDHRARLHERLPDVRASLGPCPPEAREHVRRVRRAVDSLHRSDDAKLAEPGDVLAV